MKKNIYLIFFSILITFFLIEIILRIFLPQALSTPWRVYQEDGLLLNKNYGIAKHYFLKNNIQVKYTFGINHNRKYDSIESEDKILILGDSFTFGWLLKDEDTFVFKLKNKFTKYEFINAAAGGHGTSDQLRYFEKFCNKIKPKFTFILINANDIKRSEFSNLYTLDKENNLINGSNKIPKLSYIVDNNILYEFLISNFHSISFLRKIYSILNNSDRSNKVPIGIKNIQKDKYVFEKKLFEKFGILSKKCNTDLNLINLAWLNRETNSTPTYEFLKNRNNFFEENNINYIDLHNKMKVKYMKNKDYEIIGEGHPNKKANKLYFDILSDEFEKVIN